VAAILGFGVGVLSSRFIPGLNDAAIEQALIYGDDVEIVFMGRRLLCGAIYYAIFPMAASLALFLEEGVQTVGPSRNDASS
jgi:hypothetical protein